MFELNEVEKTRFWSNIEKKGEDECWNWTGYVAKSGYGQLRMRQQNFNSHRMAHFLLFGESPSNISICHKCDNRLCCNPKHLFQGTAKDNTTDMIQKKRHCYGEQVVGSMLESQVLEIKQLYSTGQYTQTELARKFGVVQSTIGRIISGHRWKHLSASTGLESAIS